MNRNDMRPMFRKFPKSVLLTLMIIVGLPTHLIVGCWSGLVDGWNSFISELNQILRLS